MASVAFDFMTPTSSYQKPKPFTIKSAKNQSNKDNCASHSVTVARDILTNVIISVFKIIG